MGKVLLQNLVLPYIKMWKNSKNVKIVTFPLVIAKKTFSEKHMQGNKNGQCGIIGF